ncbi:hypothetical protein BDV36DRAFT_274083 [Aspergillus pseudocaelatus]|uniref:Uncharacterized protein n=1 Tax=Aspergillus pseudocaelatus TaxID=1825620 RepID=A0ABQ6W3B2_9EURO|nr:hypothetical protein BDV36DRAFT_274083 [Aspergillus pseudocaelatus]
MAMKSLIALKEPPSVCTMTLTILIMMQICIATISALMAKWTHQPRLQASPQLPLPALGCPAGPESPLSGH